MKRYPAVPKAGLSEVVPCALETFGRLGSSAIRVLREARQRVKESDSRFSGWMAVVLGQKWHARLSCALAWRLWDAASGSWDDVGAPSSTWDDCADFVAQEL